jgi:hypothetical protein
VGLFFILFASVAMRSRNEDDCIFSSVLLSCHKSTPKDKAKLCFRPLCDISEFLTMRVNFIVGILRNITFMPAPAPQFCRADALDKSEELKINSACPPVAG